MKKLSDVSRHIPFAESGRTHDMHARVREVLKHHNLTEVGDSVIEADLIEAVLASIKARKEVLNKEYGYGTS